MHHELKARVGRRFGPDQEVGGVIPGLPAQGVNISSLHEDVAGTDDGYPLLEQPTGVDGEEENNWCYYSEKRVSGK